MVSMPHFNRCPESGDVKEVILGKRSPRHPLTPSPTHMRLVNAFPIEVQLKFSDNA
jgi:hypothetical protein